MLSHGQQQATAVKYIPRNGLPGVGRQGEAYLGDFHLAQRALARLPGFKFQPHHLLADLYGVTSPLGHVSHMITASTTQE